MEILEELQAWVAEQVGTAELDRCGHQPGALGLFPQGVQLLRQWEDVTGGKKRKVRYRFLLRLVAPPGEDPAGRLLQLQAAAAKAGYEATDGKLQKAGSAGLGIYEIRLTAEREEII
jgi:hypothetical protein